MISVIMPTFNEVGNIGQLIDRVAATLKKDFEIIVVDDDSPDGTPALVRRLQKGRPFLKLIVRKNERGLPSAIETGIKAARGDIVSWLDCDLSMPPEKLKIMVKMLNHSDIVIGSRYIKGAGDSRGNPLNVFSSIIINGLSGLLFGFDITDYTSGFIVVRKETISGIKFLGQHGTYFINLLVWAKSKHLKVAETPYLCVPRHTGQSKINGLSAYIRSGLYYLKTILVLKFQQIFHYPFIKP